MDITPTPEDAICHLIEALKAAGPHIEALHSRIIRHGDRAAHEQLSALVSAASEMIDDATQQDFMNIERYAALARDVDAADAGGSA